VNSCYLSRGVKLGVVISIVVALLLESEADIPFTSRLSCFEDPFLTKSLQPAYEAAVFAFWLDGFYATWCC